MSGCSCNRVFNQVVWAEWTAGSYLLSKVALNPPASLQTVFKLGVLAHVGRKAVSFLFDRYIAPCSRENETNKKIASYLIGFLGASAALAIWNVATHQFSSDELLYLIYAAEGIALAGHVLYNLPTQISRCINPPPFDLATFVGSTDEARPVWNQVESQIQATRERQSSRLPVNAPSFPSPTSSDGFSDTQSPPLSSHPEAEDNKLWEV